MKQARTDNASLLEANINQILSSEKLNGDACFEKNIARVTFALRLKVYLV